MSNLTKGTVGFAAGGKNYTLCYSVNALCALEEHAGAGAAELSEQIGNAAKLRIGTVRVLFWAGLLDQMPDITEEEAGRIMTQVGIGEAIVVIGRAMAAAFPTKAAAGPLGRRQGKPGKR